MDSVLSMSTTAAPLATAVRIVDVLLASGELLMSTIPSLQRAFLLIAVTLIVIDSLSAVEVLVVSLR